MSTANKHAHTIAWLESVSRWLADRAAVLSGQCKELEQQTTVMDFTAPVAARVRHTAKLTASAMASNARFLHDLSRYTRKEANRLRDVDTRAAALHHQITNQLAISASVELGSELEQFRQNEVAWEHAYFPADQVAAELQLAGETEGDDHDDVPAVTAQRVQFNVASVRATASTLMRISKGLQDHQAGLQRQLHTIPSDMSHHLHGSLDRTRHQLPPKFERQAARLVRQSTLLSSRMSIEDLFPTGTISGPVPIPGWRFEPLPAAPVLRVAAGQTLDDLIRAFRNAVEMLVVEPVFTWVPVERMMLLGSEETFRAAVTEFVAAVDSIVWLRSDDGGATHGDPHLDAAEEGRGDDGSQGETVGDDEGTSDHDGTVSDDDPGAGEGSGHLPSGGGGGGVLPVVIGGGGVIAGSGGGGTVPDEGAIDAESEDDGGTATDETTACDPKPTAYELMEHRREHEHRRIARAVEAAKGAELTARHERHPNRSGFGPGVAALGTATVTGAGGALVSRRRRRDDDFADFEETPDDLDSDYYYQGPDDD